ncbi:MAG TPA: PDZ domain-containing protein [Puia sp.]|jgi:tricorn protease|nr:PDZ domain-containing protein [Puia sp.]
MPFTSLFSRILLIGSLAVGCALSAGAQGTRLLRQPSLSATQIAFEYGGDIWVVAKGGGEASRITSTPAVESDPHFSPDGKWITFTSDRTGTPQVYVVPAEGGNPKRLTWFPAAASARGWTPDGKRVLYSSPRETAPVGYGRLWSVAATGGPSTMLPEPMGWDGSYSPDGKKIVVDRVSRWDVEWRHYRGGQNTPLRVLDLATLEEQEIPSADRSEDIRPVWMGDEVYFLSDRDFYMNVWAWSAGKGLRQITHGTEGDIKWLTGFGGALVYERGGYLYSLDPASGKGTALTIVVHGDFPWAEPHWENVTKMIADASLSPTGKRILIEARGDIYTVPVENGSVRNLTHSSDAADRRPVWSPDGKQVAWFSDKGGEGYALYISDQEGKGEPRKIPIGESKLGWEPCWSPDGKYIAFEDNKVRIQVVDIATGKMVTADVAGVNLERGSMGLVWSPDSKWLAYSKTAPNNFTRITVWSVVSGQARTVSDPMADATSPAWDRDDRHLYFLASTDAALGSGWANTSSILARPSYAGYVVNLRKEDPPPFPLKSDEEADTTKNAGKNKDSVVRIDWDNVDKRTIPLPIPAGSYRELLSGPKGSVFLVGDGKITKFILDTKKTEDFAEHAGNVRVSENGEKLLFQSGNSWRVVATSKPPAPGEGAVVVNLRMDLDRLAEWKQIFTEAYRYERDYFYDPAHHGRDWKAVWDYYSPQIAWVRHRADLNYLLDQLGGELSVGHSFVFGGDFPAVDTNRAAGLGADLAAENGRWRIKRIYTAESWNPELVAPLSQPELKVAEGDYILAIDGQPVGTEQDPYELLEGHSGQQTLLLVNDKPSTDGAWTIKVTPVVGEGALRQRAWVEDNRRRVEELSHGKLGYVWVPNTGGPGFVSFNRYYFAQQDKEGAVIDERFNGGGLLDDYMVDLMIRRVRAAVTNEVPDGKAFRLPAGILGPKVLLINEMAGSGGDFFPWVFRHQQVGPLIGARTWGGLVKSSVHYSFIDGGAMTAPDNAVFDPIANKWIAENQGVPPDVEVKLDAASVSKGRDVQLERAVEECLKLLEKEPAPTVTHPPYSKPAVKE